MAKQKKQFKVIIERDEDGFFMASVPALSGCYTQAKTLSQLTKRIREAISLCLELAKTDPQYRAKLKEFTSEPTFIGLEVVEV